MEPFRVEVPQSELDDLADRVRRTRWTRDLGHRPWERGMPSDVLRELATYWVEGYDWRAAEERINAVPGFRTEVDGQSVHLLHQRSDDPEAVPLVLTHGWPGAVWEFLPVLDRLTATGPGSVHAVVPALPGYGWSSPLAGEGWTVDRVARTWIALMDELGYDRFAVQGGDWGSAVSRQVAVLAPDRVVGLHLNMLMQPIPDGEPADDTERAHRAQMEAFRREGRGYNLLQSTRPDTLAHALGDSPVGLLAWVLEKFHAWTDPGRPFGGIDRDTLLTIATTYWLTDTAGSSAQLYWENKHHPSPTGRSPCRRASRCSPTTSHHRCADPPRRRTTSCAGGSTPTAATSPRSSSRRRSPPRYGSSSPTCRRTSAPHPGGYGADGRQRYFTGAGSASSMATSPRLER